MAGAARNRPYTACRAWPAIGASRAGPTGGTKRACWATRTLVLQPFGRSRNPGLNISACARALGHSVDVSGAQAVLSGHIMTRPKAPGDTGGEASRAEQRSRLWLLGGNRQHAGVGLQHPQPVLLDTPLRFSSCARARSSPSRTLRGQLGQPLLLGGLLQAPGVGGRVPNLGGESRAAKQERSGGTGGRCWTGVGHPATRLGHALRRGSSPEFRAVVSGTLPASR